MFRSVLVCNQMDEQGVIKLQYQLPNEGLTPFVSTFYHFDYAGDALNELERADRAQFRIILNGTGRYRLASGIERRAYPVTIVGPTTAPIVAMASEPIRIFGWGMTPLGWAALMGSEAENWIDQILDARRIFGNALSDLQQQLSYAASIEEQFTIGQAAAEGIFAKADRAPFEFTAIVDQWLLDDVDHEIEQLVAATGISMRQLERMTKRFYGMPPKKLARKYRALRAAYKLAAGDSLDDSELGLAFYDQSHLIREIKLFTGLTPGQLKAGKAELTVATMRERGKLGRKVSPLVSES